MTHKSFIHFLAGCLAWSTGLLTVNAQTCTLHGGDPIPGQKLQWASETYDASLIGFPELVTTGETPRFYRRKTITGEHTYHIYWSENTCDSLLTDDKRVYDVTCQYNADTGVLSGANNSYEDYFGSGPQPLAVNCDDFNSGAVNATTAVDVLGDGSCIAYGSYLFGYRAHTRVGTVTTSLTDEDKEPDAKKRATIASGSLHTAYHTKRTGRSFSACDVTFTANVDVQCPGNYVAKLHCLVKVRGSSEDAIPEDQDIEFRGLHSGTQTISGQVVAINDDTDYTLVSLELTSPCSADNGGASTDKENSIHRTISLGRGVGNAAAGSLNLDAEAFSAALYNPSALVLARNPYAKIEVVNGADEVLRQVKAPQVLADIVTLDTSSYEVRFYPLGQVGAQDATTKIYTLSGSPLVTHKFENPDAALSLTKRLRITETRGSNVRVVEYAYDAANAMWSLSSGNGLRKESLATAVSGADTTKTYTVRDENDDVVSKTTKTYHTFDWGEEQTGEILDPDGAALTTTYLFYSNSGSDGDNYGHLQLRTNPDGSWERHTWNAAGMPLKIVRPFLNSASTAAENLCRVTDYSYSSLSDADGDGIADQLTSTVESVLGQETSRTYRVDWSAKVTLAGDVCQRRSDIRCVAAGAAWNAADNLVTETLLYTATPFTGRERRVIRPDGTATLSAYSVDSSGQQTVTVGTGKPNGGFDSIIAGTSSVAVTNAQGQLIAKSETDIESGLTFSSWVATAFDSLGRPTRIDYPDSTYELRDYICCGLGSTTDRAGLVTSYQYDDLGRQTDATTNGITMHTGYDADGRVKAVTRIGTDNSSMVQSTKSYDYAGRLTEHHDALNRLTTYAEIFSSGTGQTTRTTTAADGGTTIEIRARDGSPVSVSGTAAAPRSFAYGVDTDGLYTKQTMIGESGATTEWVKTYTDFAGRTYKTVLPDDASSQSYFNTAGQLTRQVDPDGVTTLFVYNSRGEQETVAIDLNANNTIDYGGTDRITKTVNDVATHGTVTVQRTTTKVWETDSTDTGTSVAIAEAGTDGLHSWQTVRGLTTVSVTVLDGSGGSTVTTTAPDGVKTIQVYSGGLLSSTTVKTAADAQLAAVTYAYDVHHRLQTSTDARNGATSYSYYADDQVHTVVTPDPDTTRSGDGYDPQTTTYTYESAGRVDTVTQPDATVVHTTYWPTGAVKRTWGSRTYPVEYTYDPQGRVKTLKTWQNFSGDAGQAVTTWNYNSQRGWLDNKRYNDSTGPSYTYWPSGLLHTRVWARTPAITTTYAYNTAGDLQGIDYSDATPDVSLTYDRTGRPKSRTDGSGVCNWSYDTSGQLKDEDYASGALSGLGVHRAFDSLSRLSGVSAVTSAPATLNSVGYSYDVASRLDVVTQGSNTATYSYAANSPQVDTVTFKNSGTTRLTTTSSYDYLNRLRSVTNTPSSSSVASVGYAYNSANQRTKATREDNAYWTFGYDPLGQVTSGKKYLADDSALAGYDYGWTYDDIGNRKTAAVNGQTVTYTPNALNQYTQRTVPGVVDVSGAAASTATVTVALNSGTPQATTRQGEQFFKQLTVNNASAAQNPSIKITGVKNLVGSGGEDAVTEVTKIAFLPQSPESFIHDADGNLTDDARWHYTWDGENRLIVMETSTVAVTAGVTKQKLEFAYDGMGRRYSKKVSSWSGSAWILSSSTLFLYDGWNLLVDLNALSSNAVVCTYAWGSDLSGSQQDAGGVGGLLFASSSALSSPLHAPCYDGNGNVIGLVDMATGTKSATYDYNAFGETIQSDGVAVANHFRFSTKYTDDETGLLYYGYRFYQPSTGCWLSKDPSEEDGSTNLYGFLSNAALAKIDRLGLYEIDVHYYLTAWLASKVPCLSDDAVTIATADQGVDENPETKPGYGGDKRQKEVNARHHALHPGPQGGPDDAYMKALRDEAFSTCDAAKLGVYLHYFQDAFSHRGFTDPEWGHAKAGHNPDKTANDVSRAAAMAIATLDEMIAWSKSCKKCCKDSSVTGKNALSRDEIGNLFSFLRSPGGGFSDEINSSELAKKLDFLKMQPR